MEAGLPPLLAPGLKVVFVGTEPGPESLRTQSYYANRRNSFWKDLHSVGLVSIVLEPADFRDALDFGIGLDDVYDDPAGLRRRLVAASPRAVCFNSKAALVRMAEEQVVPPWSGANASRWVALPSMLVWALPDSSPTASAYRTLRLNDLKELKRRVQLSDGHLSTG
jgi:G:T/U-mismatch repair DNA glycosylase